MATVSEINSLNSIQYKSKVKPYLLIFILPFLFLIAFVSFYPIGDKIKAQLKSHLSGTGCNPDFSDIRLEFLLPKVVVSDVSLPARCFNRAGEAVKLSHLTLNFHFINFSPIGLPFRLDTELSGQPLSLHYVLGIGKQLIRLKDQELDLARLKPLIGDTVKLDGKVTVDLNLLMEENIMQTMALKAVSKNLRVPPQDIFSFSVPNLKMNDFFLDASSSNGRTVVIERLLLGDTESPIRANFKGKIDLAENAIQLSPINLVGEIAFSQTLKEIIPFIDITFAAMNQKDGFYQVRLGGTIAQPIPSNP